MSVNSNLNLVADSNFADLELVRACIAGERAALATFDKGFLLACEPALIRMGISYSLRQDLLQEVRVKLFVGTEAAGPKIAQYSGLGPLRSWVRAVVVRTAVEAIRRPGRVVSSESTIFAASDLGTPELAAASSHFSREFKVAFSEAIEELSKRDRLLLRQYVLDGLTIIQLGKLHGIHSATVFRWIERSRVMLERATRKRLMKRLRVDAAELDSMLSGLSRIDVSVRRLLQTNPVRQDRLRG